MSRFAVRSRLIGAGLLALVATAGSVGAQVISPIYSSNYSFIDLGSVPGLPTNYGGLTLKHDDPNTLIIGGSANNALGEIYAIGVVRDANQHITGFTGSATFFADGPNNDGGVAYGPGNVLFLARYPVHELAQVKPGNTTTDKVIALGPLSIPGSIGGVGFVPAGQPGAGQIKFAAFNGGGWTSAEVAPDGNGTYNLTNIVNHLASALPGGPEGFIYVPTGSPLFTSPTLLVSAWNDGRIDAYDVDSNGDPLPATRRAFITGLSGAEGAFIDPVTGDFLFSTYGGGNHVIAVRGFASVPEPGATGLVGIGVLGWAGRRRRKVE